MTRTEFRLLTNGASCGCTFAVALLRPSAFSALMLALVVLLTAAGMREPRAHVDSTKVVRAPGPSQRNAGASSSGP